MKKLKKLTAILLVVVMALAMCVTAFAANDGSITIDNAVKGTTYSAYKIFDATYSNGAVSYTIPDGSAIANATDFDTVFTTTTNGGKTYVTKKDGVTDDAVVTWLKSYVKSASLTAAKTQTNTNGATKVTLSELPYGYYYVGSTPTEETSAAISLTTVAPNANVTDKNDSTPKVDTDDGKKVATSADGTYGYVATMDVGSTAYFKITFDAVNYTVKNGEATQIQKYTVTDTPDGFDINKDTVTVTVGGTTLASTAYTVSKADDEKLTVEIPWVNNGNSIYTSPSEVVISYNATLTNKNVAGKSTNTAQIKYDDTEIPNVPDAEVYNYKIQVDKYAVKTSDREDTTSKLSGAKFVLKNKDGKFYKLGENGVVSWVDNQTDATEVMTDSTGAAAFAGLAAGEYTLVETEAPAGYNLLKEGTTVTLYAVSEKVTDTTVLTVTSKVGNESGASLPTTGGMGTTLLYTVGILLILGAGVTLVVRRRMNVSR